MLKICFFLIIFQIHFGQFHNNLYRNFQQFLSKYNEPFFLCFISCKNINPSSYINISGMLRRQNDFILVHIVTLTQLFGTHHHHHNRQNRPSEGLTTLTRRRQFETNYIRTKNVVTLLDIESMTYQLTAMHKNITFR